LANVSAKIGLAETGCASAAKWVRPNETTYVMSVARSEHSIRSVKGTILVNGFVFQRFNLFPHLTALENVAVGPVQVLATPNAAAREQARALLARSAADRLVMFDQGVIVEEGPPDELMTDPEHDRIRAFLRRINDSG
jgi:ABC-type polar amino acid transport system ATPase subunit